MENAAVRLHRQAEAAKSAPSLLDARWIVLLCDCGKSTGSPSERCPTCFSPHSHPVEMRLTEPSALVYALRHKRSA